MIKKSNVILIEYQLFAFINYLIYLRKKNEEGSFPFLYCPITFW